jgi:hypothetical protein
MKMIYFGGFGVSFKSPIELELLKQDIKSFEVKRLKNWNSPNLIIQFNNGHIFEQPTPLIINYNEVIKHLKSIKC